MNRSRYSLQSFVTSGILLGLLTVLLGIAYPVIVWGIGQLLFHHEAEGALLKVEGRVVGSLRIAQKFTQAHYFHPRPSSAGTEGYDASHSSGSNLGPTSQKLIDLLRERVAAYRSENDWSGPVPADAVTASGSGLDPHISVANARIQAGRVAKARNLSPEKIEALLREHIQEPTLWLWGEKRVNVLKINLALDQISIPVEDSSY